MKFAQAVSALPLAAALVAAAPVAKRADILDGKSISAWWGQDGNHDLSEVCASVDFDIVMMSFLTQLGPAKLNLASHTGGPSAAQKAAKYPGLVDGTVAAEGKPSIADQIKGCQKNGKKVMISFGGDAGVSNAKFASSEAATDAANEIWNLVLGGTDTKVVPANVRPFGSVVLDGVDLDNESGDGSNYKAFTDKLRSLMNGDKGRQYLISAAPQVTDTGSDTAIPDEIYGNLDFVNVQFYNNPQAGQIGKPGFLAAASNWNDKIKKLNSKAKLMIGVPGSNKGATGQDVGVRSASQISQDVSDVKGKNLSQFGGFAIWSAGFAMDNSNWQKNVKDALNGKAVDSNKAQKTTASVEDDVTTPTINGGDDDDTPIATPTPTKKAKASSSTSATATATKTAKVQKAQKPKVKATATAVPDLL